MDCNFLQLNADKSELLTVVADSNNIGSLRSTARSNLKNLGFIFDQAINLDKHVKHLSHTCFFHLRNKAKLRCVWTRDDHTRLFIHTWTTVIRAWTQEVVRGSVEIKGIIIMLNNWSGFLRALTSSKTHETWQTGQSWWKFTYFIGFKVGRAKWLHSAP